MPHEQTPVKTMIDEDQVLVALQSEAFDQKVRELVKEDEASLIERIVYLRGDLPQRRFWVDRLWWGLGVLGGLVFLYGLYSLGLKGLQLFVQ
jgi:hypothetical protein